MKDSLLLSKKSIQVAHIRAAECIGCTKCIQACPFDAIIGSARYLHTVLTEACTGCGLCVSPCPVDCIEMIPGMQCDLKQAGARVKARKQRLQKAEKQQAETLNTTQTLKAQQSYIQEALKRVNVKRGKN